MIRASYGALELYLCWMKIHGSSVILNWGEDNNAWECSWISSGERFVGISVDSPLLALTNALDKAGQYEIAMIAVRDMANG